MRTRLATLFLGLFTGLALLLGSPLNAFFGMASMHGMMPQNQCQTSCGVQTPVGVPAIRHDLEDKEIDPQPAEPHYVAFIGVGWVTVITVAAAYLLKYLRWRPPDLFKLNVAYRF